MTEPWTGCRDSPIGVHCAHWSGDVATPAKRCCWCEPTFPFPSEVRAARCDDEDPE